MLAQLIHSGRPCTDTDALILLTASEETKQINLILYIALPIAGVILAVLVIVGVRAIYIKVSSYCNECYNVLFL